MTGHCKDCRWFNCYRPDGGPLNQHAELFPKSDAGECQRTSKREMSGVNDTNTLAYVRTEKPSYGILVVHPEFGCIQFEQKSE